MRARSDVRPPGDGDQAPVGAAQRVRGRERRGAVSGPTPRAQVRQSGVLRRRGPGVLHWPRGLHRAAPHPQVGFSHVLSARGAPARHAQRRRDHAERVEPQGPADRVLARDPEGASAARHGDRPPDDQHRREGLERKAAAARHRDGQQRLDDGRQHRRLAGRGDRRASRADRLRRFALSGWQHGPPASHAHPARPRHARPSVHALFRPSK